MSGYQTEYQQNMDFRDPEMNAEFEFSEKSVRAGFIRKVYAILSLQLVVTFGIVAIFVFIDGVQDYAARTPALFYSAIVITLVLIIALACGGNFRRKTPYNYIALAIFTLSEGYLLGCASATYDKWEVILAIGVTLIVTIALTIFAFQTKIDFTMMSGLLFTLLMVLMMFGIFALIFQDKVLNILYGCLGALIFSFYLVFDTQMMLGGNHKYSISPEEYIFAALNLYLDIINLFLYLLAIIGGSRS
ncbi:hypothetical protein Pmani_004989 [Petrolisthes manimaculis]|uniref:Uncharacterized protein n=1 Tax=Petrolisthes manimaculis TaxID=1843537 RepID=A0AAE1UHX9_9EUCA|nr:hypothetical protein Pmani_004989 [Petrolisthes manimaculis]